MTNLWPWLAVAGLGAFHGLNPANGWMFAAALGTRTRDRTQVLRVLPSIALGHSASVAMVASAVALGMWMDRTRVQRLAGALLIGVALYRWLRGDRTHMPLGVHAGRAGIALWSFLMATAHGAGLMLVPALVPLCLADNPARDITASGSLALAMAAFGVHMAAMLATTGAIAIGLCRGVAMHPGLLGGVAPRHAWTATLAVTGMLLVVLRP